VIWIGTAARLDLVAAQAQVLEAEPAHGMDAVVAWAATDELYRCGENSTACALSGGNRKFKFLPFSAVNTNKAGWQCAQRRPLRALSHALLLFDPTFAVVLDDDTFLNYRLLMQRFGAFLYGDMMQRPLYMGEFTGRSGPQGHLTTEGTYQQPFNSSIIDRSIDRFSPQYD
jgi:hypothetical protein